MNSNHPKSILSTSDTPQNKEAFCSHIYGDPLGMNLNTQVNFRVVCRYGLKRLVVILYSEKNIRDDGMVL